MSAVDGVMVEDDVIEISHDLRGPLSVIALEVTMLDETLPGVQHDARQALGRIARNIDFLDALLQDMLDKSAIDAARFGIRGEPTELGVLVARVLERIVTARDHARVTFERCATAMVRADVRRIERVVANLVHNALKHAPREAPIAIRMERFADRVRVEVTDGGPGIRPGETSRVFEKFRRAADTRVDGSGLGLYVARKIVEAHGGTIGVTSVWGEGSRFHFDLPLLDPRAR